MAPQMEEIAIRPFAPADALPAARLARTGFDAFVAADCTDAGCRAFHDFAAPAHLRERLANGHFGHLAWSGAILAGVLIVREPAHLLTLFVDARYHRRGIARRLLVAALESVRANGIQVSAMTVNASPYAVRVYEKLGFDHEGPRTLESGIACVPMRLALDDAFWAAASQADTGTIVCAASQSSGNNDEAVQS